MARLTTARRRGLPTSEFALPGRRYPIDTENRARNALARISQFGSPLQQTVVRRAVRVGTPS